jgi:hypothetical protein
MLCQWKPDFLNEPCLVVCLKVTFGFNGEDMGKDEDPGRNCDDAKGGTGFFGCDVGEGRGVGVIMVT